MVKPMFLKKVDIVLILLCISLSIGAVFFAFKGNSGTPSLIINTPAGEFVYKLNKDQELSFFGPLGITHVHIQDGIVTFTDSPCDNKTCVSSAPISKNGDWIACLPNQIFARIEGKEENNDNQLDITGF